MTDSLKDFAAGTAGGFAGKLLDYPLDTVKVLLQTQHSSTSPQINKPYRGAWHALTHTIQTRGVAGLYQGISSPLLGSMAENALLFYAYRNFKRLLGETSEHELDLLSLSLAGAGAGAFVPLVLTPVEVSSLAELLVAPMSDCGECCLLVWGQEIKTNSNSFC